VVSGRSDARGRALAIGLTTSGDAYCWGSNDAGQLGDGTTTYHANPVPVGMPRIGRQLEVLMSGFSRSGR